jgi:hypothetical protein
MRAHTNTRTHINTRINTYRHNTQANKSGCYNATGNSGVLVNSRTTTTTATTTAVMEKQWKSKFGKQQKKKKKKQMEGENVLCRWS